MGAKKERGSSQEGVPMQAGAPKMRVDTQRIPPGLPLPAGTTELKAAARLPRTKSHQGVGLEGNHHQVAQAGERQQQSDAHCRA